MLVSVQLNSAEDVYIRFCLNVSLALLLTLHSSLQLATNVGVIETAPVDILRLVSHLQLEFNPRCLI